MNLADAGCFASSARTWALLPAAVVRGPVDQAPLAQLYMRSGARLMSWPAVASKMKQFRLAFRRSKWWATRTVRGRTSLTRTTAMPDPILREKAREAIHSGRLPGAVPRRTLSGPSAGATCAVCREPIPCGEMEFELEFRARAATDEKSLRDTLDRLHETPEVPVHLHDRCFAAWDFERIKLGGAAARRRST